MACILNGTYTFVNGNYRDASVPSLDYSDYNVTFNGEQLNFIDTIRVDDALQYLFAKGGTTESPIFPAIAIVAGIGIGAFTAEADYEGEATLSICEKESDSDACPDVPFSESAPEKYADYFNEDGVFVPKATSGGGDCAFTTATLRIVDENGEQPRASVPDISSPFPSIDDDGFYCVIPDGFGDYIVPLYNGEIVIRMIGEILSSSGNIEIGRTIILTGDATISVPTAGDA